MPFSIADFVQRNRAVAIARYGGLLDEKTGASKEPIFGLTDIGGCIGESGLSVRRIEEFE